MREAVLALSNSVAAWIVVKATIILLLGLLAAVLLRGSRAAVRHALLAATFAVLLLLPLASVVAPPVRIGMRTATLPLAGSITRLNHITHPPDAPRQPSWPPLSTLLLWGWMAGSALILLPVAIGLWQVRGLRRSALPWLQGQPLVDALARDLGIDRRIQPLLHEALPGPMTCGVLHPAIVLPKDAGSWNRADLTRALIHELEHVRRNDWAIRSLARIVCTFYWFHPLAWMAWRRLELEAERSCDDAVLAQSEAIEYADQLVGLARRVSHSPLLAMANRADLSVRVNAVLDSRQRRGRTGTLALILVSAAAMLVLSIAPVRMVAAPQAMINLADDVGLVVINVTVTDQNGKVVQGLTANDFVLTENGVQQSIAVFEFQTPEGLPGYYLLGYYTLNPRGDGSFHTIKIVGRRDDMAKLEYRRGYYSPVAAPPDFRGSVDSHSVTGIKAPQVIFKVNPEYTEEARRAKYSGTVILSVDVSPAGEPGNISVVRGLGLGLDEKAIEAVSRWRFRPGTKDGEPVTVQALVGVTFRLL
jgi:TonB family protein